MPDTTLRSIYDFKCKDAQNTPVDFATLKGKVLLIVNVASLCGFTPQYHELQTLHSKYASRGLVILAFPCNQFGNQEPRSSRHVARDMRDAYGVDFAIMKKCNVNGEDTLDLYAFLKSRQRGLFGFEGVRWNFEKFVVSAAGEVVARFDSWVTPLQFENYLSILLSECEADGREKDQGKAVGEGKEVKEGKERG
ncbi:uncharacterized protein LODBEIA_P43780 [Lodderomyces beijingensis]|uniref:Glutathione peroxidase n=1 Tax=Lodderomyces beijingensis TaxID=1775926 RepID=A0ABP0ZPT7_9ASCO